MGVRVKVFRLRVWLVMLLVLLTPHSAAHCATSWTVDVDRIASVAKILLTFRDDITGPIKDVVTRPENYKVVILAVDGDSAQSSAVERRGRVHRVLRVAPKQLGPPHSQRDSKRDFEVFVEDFFGVGASGVITVQAMAGVDANGDSVGITGGEAKFELAGPYAIGMKDQTFMLELRGGTIAAAFSFGEYEDVYTGANGDLVSRSWRVEGKVPVDTAGDLEALPGASEDSTAELNDYVTVTYARKWYDGKKIGRVAYFARATGQFQGLEAGANFRPWVGYGNRLFYAAEFEAGYRNGNAEFTAPGLPAPDRGHLLARAGVVVELMPRLGGLNRDLGQGLRFFVRGRGWADRARYAGGDSDWRYRPYVDAELFYDLDGDHRVFLRHETGYLPPDLSQRVRKTFIGVGKRF